MGSRSGAQAEAVGDRRRQVVLRCNNHSTRHPASKPDPPCSTLLVTSVVMPKVTEEVFFLSSSDSADAAGADLVRCCQSSEV